MTTVFRKSYLRDHKKIKDHDIRDRVRQAIEQVEAATELQAIGDLKKLGGAGNLFRIRVGDYRIIYEVETAARQVTIHHVRQCREVYRDL